MLPSCIYWLLPYSFLTLKCCGCFDSSSIAGAPSSGRAPAGFQSQGLEFCSFPLFLLCTGGRPNPQAWADPGSRKQKRYTENNTGVSQSCSLSCAVIALHIVMPHVTAYFLVLSVLF
uniref:Secreted protein n=1 Tax=Anguilla anguilla TaxID=7936 RepID=A0A0E9XMV0_ANGAN